jgi:hypothetical protein
VASQPPDGKPLSDSDLVDRLAAVRSSLDRARASSREAWESRLDSGLSFDGRERIEVSVRRRGRRYDIGDEGRAASAAGTRRGWLETAERVVAEVGLNVNRHGVVFVSAVEGRDIASLVMQVAETSLAVYSALLESQDRPSPRR